MLGDVLRLPASVLAVLAAMAILTGPAQAKVVDSYCSPSGDFCLSVKKGDRAVRMQIATFSFSGEYALCVEPPAGGRDCDKFELRRRGDIYEDSVSLAGNFPDRASGRYSVTWKLSGGKIGKTLHFRL